MESLYESEALASPARPVITLLAAIQAVEPLVAAAAMVVLGPVMIAVGLVTAVLSRRSPLIRHTRVGFRGAPLRMLKFRTMWMAGAAPAGWLGVEEVSDYVPEAKTLPDPRVTSKFAAWCRRHSLDELPQLYHVVRGEMSFIGPRPITRAEFDQHYGPEAREVLLLRPGLVGLWQVMGHNQLSYPQRRRLDLLLARRACAALYVHILVRGIAKVWSGNGAY